MRICTRRTHTHRSTTYCTPLARTKKRLRRSPRATLTCRRTVRAVAVVVERTCLCRLAASPRAVRAALGGVLRGSWRLERAGCVRSGAAARLSRRRPAAVVRKVTSTSVDGTSLDPHAEQLYAPSSYGPVILVRAARTAAPAPLHARAKVQRLIALRTRQQEQYPGQDRPDFPMPAQIPVVRRRWRLWQPWRWQSGRRWLILPSSVPVSSSASRLAFSFTAAARPRGPAPSASSSLTDQPSSTAWC
jgi:hypothetical protein